MKSLVSIMDKDNRWNMHDKVKRLYLMNFTCALSLYLRYTYPVILKPSTLYDITDMNDYDSDDDNNDIIQNFYKTLYLIHRSVRYYDNNFKFLVNNNSKLAINNSSEFIINELFYNYKNDNTNSIVSNLVDPNKFTNTLYKYMYLYDRYDISSTMNITATNILSKDEKTFVKNMLGYIDHLHCNDNFTYNNINYIINIAKSMKVNTYCRILGFIIFISVSDNARNIKSLETLLKLEKNEHIFEQFSESIGIATRINSIDINDHYNCQFKFKEFYNSIIDTYDKCIAKNITIKTKSGIAYIILEYLLNESINNIFTSVPSDVDKMIVIRDAIPDYTTRSISSVSDNSAEHRMYHHNYNNENITTVVSFFKDTETINSILDIIDIILELGEYNFDMLFDSFVVTDLTNYWTNQHLFMCITNFFASTCCASYYTSTTSYEKNNIIRIIEHLVSKGYEPYKHTTMKIPALNSTGNDDNDDDDNDDEIFDDENQKIVDVANPKVTDMTYIYQDCQAFNKSRISLIYNNQKSSIPASEIFKNNVTMFGYVVEYLTTISKKNPNAFNTIKNMERVIDYIYDLILIAPHYTTYVYEMIDSYDKYNCQSKIIELVEKLLNLFSKDMISSLLDVDQYKNSEGYISEAYCKLLSSIGMILVVLKRHDPVCSDIVVSLQSLILKVFGEKLCTWGIRLSLSGYFIYYSVHNFNIIRCRNLTVKDNFMQFVNNIFIDIESTDHEILLTDSWVSNKLINAIGLVGLRYEDNKNMYCIDESKIDRDFNNPVMTNFDVNTNLTESLATLADTCPVTRKIMYKSYYCSNTFLNIQQKLLTSIFRTVDRILSVFPTNQQAFMVSPKSYFMNGVILDNPHEFLNGMLYNQTFIPSKDQDAINHIKKNKIIVWRSLHYSNLSYIAESNCVIVYIAMICYGLTHNYISMDEVSELLLVSVARCYRMYSYITEAINTGIENRSNRIDVTTDYEQTMANYINGVTCCDTYLEAILAHVLFKYMINKFNITNINQIIDDSINNIKRNMVYNVERYDGVSLDLETSTGIDVIENFDRFIKMYDKESYDLVYSNVNQFFKNHNEYLPIELRS